MSHVISTPQGNMRCVFTLTSMSNNYHTCFWLFSLLESYSPIPGNTVLCICQKRSEDEGKRQRWWEKRSNGNILISASYFFVAKAKFFIITSGLNILNKMTDWHKISSWKLKFPLLLILFERGLSGCVTNTNDLWWRFPLSRLWKGKAFRCSRRWSKADGV